MQYGWAAYTIAYGACMVYGGNVWTDTHQLRQQWAGCIEIVHIDNGADMIDGKFMTKVLKNKAFLYR